MSLNGNSGPPFEETTPAVGHTTLGRSELVVSPIALGTAQVGGNWGPPDEARAMATIHRALDLGVTLFDSAHAYGWGVAEETLGRGLRGTPRSEVFIATKGGLRRDGNEYLRDCRPAWIRRDVDASLRALQTDYIDLYQLHWPDPATPFDSTAAALETAVKEGKIRAVGVSNFTREELEAFDQRFPVATLQPPYNMFRREAEADVLPYAAAHNIGILVWGPLASGLLSGQLQRDTTFAADDWRSQSSVFSGADYRQNVQVAVALDEFARRELGLTVNQLAVAWVLAHPAVDVAIVGTSNPKHVDSAVAASRTVLDSETRARIEQILADAIPIGGPSPESRG